MCVQVVDSARFMALLLSIMFGYVVATESLLNPHRQFSWTQLLLLPYKAFFQTFGELSLDEIQGGKQVNDKSCTHVYLSALFSVFYLYG